MPKNKLETPAWIIEGYDSPAEYNEAKGIKEEKPAKKVKEKKSKSSSSKKEEKTFTIRECPECKSDEVGVVVEKEAKGTWECRKCKWKGQDIEEKVLTEDELMKFMDKKGESVA